MTGSDSNDMPPNLFRDHPPRRRAWCRRRRRDCECDPRIPTLGPFSNRSGGSMRRI